MPWGGGRGSGGGEMWEKSIQETPDIQLPRAEVGQDSWDRNFHADTLEIELPRLG